MEKQYCKRCNATKPVEEFNGINKYCIRCLEKEREKHQNNKEQRHQQSKKYREAHKEEINARRKEYSKVYNQIEVFCDICQCKVKKCRWSEHKKKLRSIIRIRSKRKHRLLLKKHLLILKQYELKLHHTFYNYIIVKFMLNVDLGILEI